MIPYPKRSESNSFGLFVLGEIFLPQCYFSNAFELHNFGNSLQDVFCAVGFLRTNEGLVRSEAGIAGILAHL